MIIMAKNLANMIKIIALKFAYMIIFDYFFSEFYEPPFWTDGVFIWSNNGNMSLMANQLSERSDSILQRTCEILNGTEKPQKVPALEYRGPDILLNGSVFLTVRGLGTLTGAFGLSLDAANKVQDEFGAWVIQKLKGL